MSWKPARALGRRVAAFGLAMLACWPAFARAADDELTLDLGGVKLSLRKIPKGAFVQGSPMNELGRERDEVRRDVTISRAFWLGAAPVTRAQFSRFVTETRFLTDAEKVHVGGFGWDGRALVQRKEFSWRNPGFSQKDEEPVVLVSYGDASAFVAWASRKTGRRVRLPTEAEWEYAARAGAVTPWANASKDDEALAFGWFRANASGRTHTVGSKRANAFGLFDMSGNVYEWCRDVYAPYVPGAVVDPENTTHTGTGPELRVLRGGSWLRDAKRGRSAARHRSAPGSRSAENGFRILVEEGEDEIAPAVRGAPSAGFAPESPVGLGSSDGREASAVDDDGPDASAQATAPTGRAASEGSAWSLFVAPIVAASSVVAWIAFRRKRRA